jgi:hypothetical protein
LKVCLKCNSLSLKIILTCNLNSNVANKTNFITFGKIVKKFHSKGKQKTLPQKGGFKTIIA